MRGPWGTAAWISCLLLCPHHGGLHPAGPLGRWAAGPLWRLAFGVWRLALGVEMIKPRVRSGRVLWLYIPACGRV
jgi:hypothetical protein